MLIETERLLIRDYQEDDWEALSHLAEDPEVARWFPWGPGSGEQARRQVRWIIEQSRQQPRQHYDLAIEARGEARVIGACFLHLRGPNRPEASLAYFVGRQERGKGYATEAAAALLRLGFEQLRLRRVFAYCEPENAASVRVLERLGLRAEGKTRDGDAALYAIGADEWRAGGNKKACPD